MSTDDTIPARQRPFGFEWAVLPGVAAGFFVPWEELSLSTELHVPPPPMFKGIGGVSPWYWLAWAVAFLVLVLPGILLAIKPRTRMLAIGYLVPALPIAGFLAFIWIGLDIYGFGPN